MARFAIIVVGAWLALGCVFTTDPQPPPQPPPDGDGTCDTAGATLRRLGGCEEALEGWEGRCRDASGADSEVGLRLPLTCWTGAGTCQAFRSCQ